MPNSTHSSAASGSCRTPDASVARIQWRPSRWLLSAIVALSALSAFSVLASEMPRPLAWPLALCAAGYGIRLLRRERRRPPETFVLRAGGAPVLLDGRALESFALHWRGPLAFARWREAGGRLQRRTWWPDTLPPARRRELRLAAPASGAAAGRASVAP